MSVLKTETRDGVLVASFSQTHFADTELIGQVGQELEALSRGAPGGRMLLDFAGVKFLSSAMLGQLFIHSKRCRSTDIQLRLCNVNPSILEVFHIVRADKLLDIHPDQASAFQSLQASGGQSQERPTDVSQLLSDAERGEVTAQFELAHHYDEGRGVEQDFAMALRWYRQAAEQDHAGAQYHLAMCYAFGIEVSEDLDEAVKWYRKAAQRGHPDAQYIMAMSHTYGLAVPQDHTVAAQWYRRAAEAGVADAQSHLASSYLEGCGVAPNGQEAIKWYTKAAEQGHADAQFSLGWFYANGEGVTEDRETAIKWYRQAADQGHQKSREMLAALQAG